jgi:2-C-methyl-D-erythritol 2,4-cyclodiphosphate synthase
MRIGYGFDIHRTDADRPLVLGGVHIDDAPFGLTGHSDADVVIHALIDALLGALALGDIGRWFPDSDREWAGADSRRLLERVVAEVTRLGWRTGNVDLTVIAERPRLAGRIEAMRRSLAGLLHCTEEVVSVKATTHEGIGPLGGQEAIAAHAVALLVPVGQAEPPAEPAAEPETGEGAP